MSHQARGHVVDALVANVADACLVLAAERACALVFGYRHARFDDCARRDERAASVVIRALLLLGRGRRSVAWREGRDVHRRGNVLQRLGGRFGNRNHRRRPFRLGGVENALLSAEGEEELAQLGAVESLASGTEQHPGEASRDVALLYAFATELDGGGAEQAEAGVRAARLDHPLGRAHRDIEVRHALGDLALKRLGEKLLEPLFAHGVELRAREAEEFECGALRTRRRGCRVRSAGLRCLGRLRHWQLLYGRNCTNAQQ